ncbi:MAG: OpgC domain-containing protein [Methylocystis sp.]|nr:OpgC domain-containing protein [Methylocystis sp.]MCA3584924.1 OpgC domain-containing protein [Methylocystis sp.]MCA3587238.1 OpgC domain-containing protein [Methylocystis sp.]MCA3591142.1 OpgC domain-containing protein [Methylocystis sp.]
MLAAPSTTHPAKAGRDMRLDLARGIMLLIIFVAHVPNNLWADYIPARFGFSSGAEIFVFVSGIASGLAFGGTFLKKGFQAGARRTLKRMLQLYGAHIATLVVLGGGALLIDRVTGSNAMAMRYDLEWLRAMPLEGFVDYARLRYVPSFFDILPMYVILLALIIPAMALARLSPMLVLGLSAMVWLMMQVAPVHFHGNPITGGNWYFNPLAWQFLFFLGFSFGVGWLKPPPRKITWLVAASVAYLAASVPLTFWGIQNAFPEAAALNKLIYPADAITVLHGTRLIHFLALAYVAYSLVDPAAAWLASPKLAPLYRVGRNSFGCFIAGLGLSMAGGVAIDFFGMSWLVAHPVNITGIALLLLAGWGLDRFNGRKPRRHVPAPSRIAEHGREAAQIA